MAYYDIEIPATVFLGIEIEDAEFASITGIAVDVRAGKDRALVRGPKGLVFGAVRKAVLEHAYGPDIPWPIPEYQVQP